MPDTSASHVTRPLDAAAAALVVLICLSWGFNQVSVKLAIHDIPPLMQGTIRSVGATILVAAWCRWRGMPLFSRDGTLVAGLVTGALFGLEFVLIYQGLAYTTATRAVLCWGLSDRYLDPPDDWKLKLMNWKGRKLPFDAQIRRKPMWDAVARSLAGRRVP